MVAMSIINEFHSAEQRAFIRTVLKRSWHISLSSLLYWRLNISGKNKTSQEYIGAGLQARWRLCLSSEDLGNMVQRLCCLTEVAPMSSHSMKECKPL